MDLSWDHFNSSQQAKTHIWSLKQQFGYVGFQEKFDTLHPHWNQPRLSPVSESSSHPLQTYFPLTSRPGSYVQNLATPCHCPWNGAKLHTFLLTQKLTRSTNPKSRLPTVPLPKICVMTPVFQDGSLPSQHTTFKSTLASSTHTNSQPSYFTS